jgi:hypothetical protein
MIERDMINKAWLIFNQQINHGLGWNDAKKEAIEEATRLRERHIETAKNPKALDRDVKSFNELIRTINEKIPAA